MLKILRALIAVSMFMSVMFCNFPIYQCKISGSFCVDKTCCISEVGGDGCDIEKNSCCEEEISALSKKTIDSITENCCIEIIVDHDVTCSINSSKDLILEKELKYSLHLLFSFKDEIFIQTSGSPPKPANIITTTKISIYKLYCSYLC